MKIIITNRIEDMVIRYQRLHGSSKRWIAEQLEMSEQRLYYIFKSTNLTLEVLLRISELLECDIKDLYSYTVEK